MTTDEAMSKAAHELDELIARALISDGDLLRAKGATEVELSDHIARAEREYAQWRVRTLADLRAWLQRDGEHLQ